MGDCADDIIKTLEINEESSSYEEDKAAFNSYYATRRNIIVERGLSMDENNIQVNPLKHFIQDLHRQADNCQYGTFKDPLESLMMHCLIV
jgi:lipase chaperone LimK